MIPCFQAGMQFSLGGQHYIMQGCAEPELGLNSTEIECYVVKVVENNEKRCLRTMRSEKKQKNNEGYDFINKESEVLASIQSQPGALKYFGKANVMDLNSCFRSCIVVELPICTLSSLFDGHLDSVSVGDRIPISVSAIQAFSVFIKQNITWSEEITFSSLVVVKNNKIAIIQGLSTCEVMDKSQLNSSFDQGYTYKKNCAQIKAIALGILLNDKDLASKHATPYNLQQFVGRVISKNKELTKLAQGYSDYPKIFQCFGLEELERFFDFAGSKYDQSNHSAENNNLQKREEIASQQLKKDAIEIIAYTPENSLGKDNISSVSGSLLPVNSQKDQTQSKSQNKAERLSIIQRELVDHAQQESQNEDYFAITKVSQKQFQNQEIKIQNDKESKLSNDNNHNPQAVSLNLINITAEDQAGLHNISGRKEEFNKEIQNRQDIGIQQVTSNVILESEQTMKNNEKHIENVSENKLQKDISTPIKNVSAADKDMEGKLAEQSNQLKMQQAQLEQLMKIIQKREQDEKDRELNMQKTKISTKKNAGKAISQIETLQEEPEEEEKEQDGEEEYDDIESQHDTSKNTILKKFQNKSTKNSSTSQLKDKPIIYDPSFTENSIMESEESAHGNNHTPKEGDNQQSSSSKPKKEVKEDDQIGSSGSNGLTRGLNDNLLGLSSGKIPTLEQFQSDRKTVRFLGGLLIVFILFCIIFGVAFNFGVSKPSSSTIICDDTNCSTCPEFADTCTACKTNYYLSSKTGACIHECTVSNCETCITDYTVCETCADGYVLALSSCYVTALSCTATNCKSCKDLVCIECDFGYKLSSDTCIKKCTQSICSTCSTTDVSVCLECASGYTLNTSTNQCA